MKLRELEPRWIHPNLFVFLCPHCKQDLLTCKNIYISDQDQYDIYEKAFGPDWNMRIVPCRADFSWTIGGTFPDDLTVTPSIDASPSGHWHGFIRNGEIV